MMSRASAFFTCTRRRRWCRPPRRPRSPPRSVPVQTPLGTEPSLAAPLPFAFRALRCVAALTVPRPPVHFPLSLPRCSSRRAAATGKALSSRLAAPSAFPHRPLAPSRPSGRPLSVFRVPCPPLFSLCPSRSLFFASLRAGARLLLQATSPTSDYLRTFIHLYGL